MARNAASFKRSKPRFLPQPTVLVICEDSKSGKRYLEDASVHFRVKVQVEITHCGKTDPLNIVKEALSRQGKFDRVFCVIDRDTHANFIEALSLAKTSKKVETITSYPCFEFWLLLHFGFSRKPYTSVGKYSAAELLIKDLRAYPGFENYDKGKDQNIFILLIDRLADAHRFASNALIQAIDSGEMNPSTRLHQLISYFETLSVPQKTS
ncbi:RloB family protein [Methylomonas rivi]|uniref:RloB family protein n=1 Tax=Methylomonas rivi TaxID=2952226 RepID=A0ABT1U2L1_9GAMM|nr:RloB family protein [Methylomonas sp. WSC-6]MBS4050704.1 RloB domain-containing protein [Methylomonas sp.]MCQ8128064.1 RloB family protein [Methylomonas sp. WSC-6]